MSTSTVLTVTVTAKVRRQDAVPRRSGAGRHLHDPRRPAEPAAAGDRDSLPDGAVPVCARDDRRRDDARRLSARASRADQLRGALPAAARAAAAAGGAGGRDELIGDRDGRSAFARDVAASRSLIAARCRCSAQSRPTIASTAEQPTVLYDGPSTKAKPLFLYGRDVPVETDRQRRRLDEGARHAGGTIGWIDRKGLSDKRMVVVRTPLADVRAAAEDAAAVVFRAERDVLLELAEPASSPSTTASPGVGEGAAPRRRVGVRADHAGVRPVSDGATPRCARAVVR